MQTKKKVKVELVELKENEFVPKKEDREFGKLYYSKSYNTMCHLCPCGCGSWYCIPIKENEWQIYPNNGEVTVTPSLQHLDGCKSHYIITKGVANIVNIYKFAYE